MTTPGGRENRQGRPITLATVLTAAVITATCALNFTDQSRALTPPPVDKAEIVYSNGGRIISINAGGSGRKVLTRSRQARTPGAFDDPVGDRFPHASPDGTKVLFSRSLDEIAPDNEFLFRGQNMLLNLINGSIREVLPATERVRYENLAWLPGTARVLASKTVGGKVTRRSVVSIELDGSRERTILNFRDYDGGFPRDNFNFEAARLAASPDGKSFLMTTMDTWSEWGYGLGVVDLATGKRKLIARGAHSGAWSPDGSRIVFVRDRKGVKACDWDFDCTPSGDLFRANADGSAVTRLTSTKRDEMSPSFSPDGSRIVFSGTRVRLLDRTTAELFSMKSEGGCEVWLTNGSPASLDPAFVAGSGELSAPPGCKPARRAPLAEGRLNQANRKGLGRRLWLGPQSSQGLLSMESDLFSTSYAIYGDCQRLKPTDCAPGVTVISTPVCSDMGDWAENLGYLFRRPESKRAKLRGVWVSQGRISYDSYLNITTVYSGRRFVTIMGAIGTDPDSISNPSQAEQLALVRELRPEGLKPGGRLPRLMIPKFDYGLARYVTRQVKRTSLKEAAEAFNSTVWETRDQVNFARNAKRVGAVPVKCPRVRDDFGAGW